MRTQGTHYPFTLIVKMPEKWLSSDIFTNWKQWVLGPTKVEKYGSSVEFMGPLP